MNEEWRDIQGFEGLYQISNYGRVKSLDHYASNGFKEILYQGKILKLHPHNGYLITHLCKNNIVKTIAVHRLVAMVFVENPNNYSQVNHLDGNKSNNHFENLEWCDQRHNVIHRVLTGLRKLKVPRDCFQYIYEEKKKGRSIQSLANEFHVGKTRIWQIVKGVEHETIGNMDDCRSHS